MAKKRKETKKETATDLVYQELKHQILSCQLAPGSVLEEDGILRKLGFSRTPLREACMRLTKEGWLISMARRGYLIPPITLKDIVDVYQLRLIVESACAQMAAMEASERDVEELEEMVRLEEQPPTDKKIGRSLIEQNTKFHVHLAEVTRNARIVGVMQSLLEQVERFDSMLSKHKSDTTWVKHTAIVAAIRKHDPGEALQRIQEHILEARQRIFSTFSGQVLELSIVTSRDGKPARPIKAREPLKSAKP